MRVLEIDEKKEFLEVLLEVPEDFYYLTLLIDKGDLVYAWSTRQVKIERETGIVKGDRVRVYLGLRVKEIEFQRFARKLRVRGVVVDAPETLHIKGSYHTIALDLGSSIRIYKKIDRYIRRVLERAVSKARRVLVVSIGEDESVIGVFSPQGIGVKFSIGFSSKRSGRERSLREIYSEYLKEVRTHVKKVVEEERYDGIVIAVPEVLLGIVGELFASLLPSLRIVKVSEGGRSGLYELLRREDTRELFREVRELYESKEVDNILEKLYRGSGKVAIGLEEVAEAARLGAVSKLVVVDELLFNDETRGLLLDTINLADRSSAEIVIVPKESEAGSKLYAFGGILAELYFPVK